MIDHKKKIQNKLQKIFNKVIEWYNTWKLQVNTKKCETILFRNVLRNEEYYTQCHWKDFEITDNLNNINVPHRRCVKCLGVHIDDTLKYNNHIKIQMDKAKNVFKKLHNLFYSRYLEKKAKIIAYQSIIRPIITYGCPIWFNVSAGAMEKLRLFERRVLRACLGKYRTEISNYKLRISNYDILNEAQIPRIDSFMIKLNRNYIKRSIYYQNNNLISGPYYFKETYFERALAEGCIPPEGFQYLDNMGYLMDERLKPIFYHYSRNNKNKKVLFDPDKINDFDMKYCRNITKYDKEILRDFSYYNKSRK